MGAYKRYREFRGKEQRAEPRVREFREFGTVSLRGITVYIDYENTYFMGSWIKKGLIVISSESVVEHKMLAIFICLIDTNCSE